MGFLDDYGINKDQVQEAGFRLAPEGKFEFEIGSAKVQKGTKNKPDEQAFVVSYQLSDADGNPKGSTDERWVMKQAGKVTERAAQSLGFLDQRLKHFGFEGGLEDPDFTSPDDLVGIRGTLEVVHTISGERKFANVRNVTAFAPGDEDDATNEFAAEAPQAPAKRAPRGKQAEESPAAANEDLWSND